MDSIHLFVPKFRKDRLRRWMTVAEPLTDEEIPKKYIVGGTAACFVLQYGNHPIIKFQPGTRSVDNRYRRLGGT